ncbi:MAG: hypothetical protein JNK46_18685 [Methylobacteriaceae bacterium]|nr:hypothetical protein [Methylobacteriaceae bacterium]
MTLNGVKDLIPFLTRLDDLRVSYTLGRFRPDTIMVTITLVGARVEIDFFDDHIEYSVFKGDEGVLDDQPALFGMIREFVEE